MTTVREPKQDRSRATRQRLLESTIVCLAEMGWGATTVAVVAEHSGVSRGAAQHHFPTREDLITAALEHMFDSRMQQAVAAAASAPAVQKTEAVLTGLMEYFTGPLFKAAVQVWTAAAADPLLKERIVPLEAKFGRVAHRTTIQALGVDDSDRATHHLVQATLDLARGLGLADLLTDDSARRGRIVTQWAATLDAALDATRSASAQR
ncbi:TetR/AcrR family transcriptional regulator [Antrihabitans sp. YC3-6]|uniref:TetR/AcrR family transcriptional regulator n=1 Tax=Antrihabitans stalagmiti TaxID=2799499 RepID=A0A934NME0_9NOCA|nr:TetR/AcrR family transcriptional regulator [Antrihabitans stalagmiti]MBJ8337898.1 TetR/AcrR family transcriptional regulator [Antrihabitans stalagmiti]